MGVAVPVGVGKAVGVADRVVHARASSVPKPKTIGHRSAVLMTAMVAKWPGAVNPEPAKAWEWPC